MNENNPQTQRGGFRPKFGLYHANAKGTGSAVKMELLPAGCDLDGCIMLTLANQKTVGNFSGASRTFATFDWERAATVKLDFGDLCQFLQVFRGESEAIAEGKGLYHRKGEFSTNIKLRHTLEPAAGYWLEIYRRGANANEEQFAGRIFFNCGEAMGLAVAFEDSIAPICFGIPRERQSRTAAAGATAAA